MESLKDLYTIIDRYLENEMSGNRVLTYEQPKDLAELLEINIDSKGESLDDLYKNVENYLKYCVNTGNRQFFNQLYGGFNLPAFVGSVVTGLTNTSMYTYEVAPAATLLEMQLIDRMCKMTGYPDGDGILVTGGSNANLIAMFSARNRVQPAGKREGMYGAERLVAFVSDQSHYSFGTAANVLGLGTEAIVKVASDESGRMIPEALDRSIKRQRKEGRAPFFVAATAGTTLLGAYDPIPAVASICERERCWLHVDGSFGGSAILSKRGRELLRGVDRADSFAWNPHKLMNIPLICSAILVREKGMLERNLLVEGADYIFHDTDTMDYDLGKKSIQCGRVVDALKLWLAWKYYGDEGYAERIDHLFALAGYLGRKIEEEPRLELMAPIQSFTVCFRYACREKDRRDEFNYTLRENLRKRGTSLVNYGYLDGELVIRFVVVNPEVEPADIDRFVANVVAEGMCLEGSLTGG